MTIKYFEMNLKNGVNIFAIKIKSQKKEFEEKAKMQRILMFVDY